MDKRSGFARWSLRFALVGLLLVVLAVFGNRLGIDFRWAMFGLVGGTTLGLLAALSGLFDVVVACRAKRSGLFPALAGSILGLVITAPVFMAIVTGSSVPPIHDITTDLQNPPEFVGVLALRTAAHNPLDRKTPTDLAALQQAGYPKLASILINKNPSQVFDEALALVQARGWEVATVSAKDGLLEATATTPVMGFKDDVVIRIRAKAGKAIVDMRSVSRVGKSDLGANAARIEAFLADLQDDER